MELINFLALLNAEQRAAFCRAINRNPVYVQQLANGSFANNKPRKPSPETARLIEEHSGGRVKRWESLPEVFDPPAGAIVAPRPALPPKVRRELQLSEAERAARLERRKQAALKRAAKEKAAAEKAAAKKAAKKKAAVKRKPISKANGKKHPTATRRRA